MRYTLSLSLSLAFLYSLLSVFLLREEPREFCLSFQITHPSLWHSSRDGRVWMTGWDESCVSVCVCLIPWTVVPRLFHIHVWKGTICSLQRICFRSGWSRTKTKCFRQTKWTYFHSLKDRSGAFKSPSFGLMNSLLVLSVNLGIA